VDFLIQKSPKKTQVVVMQVVIEKSGQTPREKVVCPQMQEIAESHIRYCSLKVFPGGDFSLILPKTEAKVIEKTSFEDAAPMGLSTQLISRISSRRERGALGPSAFSKKMIRSSCHLLEKSFGRWNISFFTLTCPFGEPEEIRKFNKMLPQLTHRLVQAVMRDVESGGGVDWFTYCIEPQKRGALHIHLAFCGRKATQNKAGLYSCVGPWLISTSRTDELWMRVLENAGFTGFQVNAACQIKKVEKSLVAYMSKYMTKGAKVFSNKESMEYQEHPPAWSGSSLSLKAEIEAGMITGELRLLRSFSFLTLSAYLNERENCLFSFPILTEEGLVVGLCGRCYPADIPLILDFIHSVITSGTNVHDPKQLKP
jgi:hypothetical protein